MGPSRAEEKEQSQAEPRRTEQSRASASVEGRRLVEGHDIASSKDTLLSFSVLMIPILGHDLVRLTSTQRGTTSSSSRFIVLFAGLSCHVVGDVPE